MKYQKSLETIKKSLYSHDPQTGEFIKNFPTNIEKSLEILINPSIDDLKMMLNKKCGYPLNLSGEKGILEFKSYYLSKDQDYQKTK